MKSRENILTATRSILRDLLKNPQSLEHIVDAWIIYGKPREPKAFFEFGERVLMKKHLEKLLSQGLAATEDDKYYRL